MAAYDPNPDKFANPDYVEQSQQQQRAGGRDREAPETKKAASFTQLIEDLAGHGWLGRLSKWALAVSKRLRENQEAKAAKKADDRATLAAIRGGVGKMEVDRRQAASQWAQQPNLAAQNRLDISPQAEQPFRASELLPLQPPPTVPAPGTPAIADQNKPQQRDPGWRKPLSAENQAWLTSPEGIKASLEEKKAQGPQQRGPRATGVLGTSQQQTPQRRVQQLRRLQKRPDESPRKLTKSRGRGRS